jgi:hypothetical protein
MSDNTGSNLGTGHIIFSSKVGDDLQFKTLVAGTNVTLANSATEITITASNDTTALNLGTGSGLFTSKSGDNLQLRSLIANAASGISVTSNANDLTLQLVSANIDAGKLGGTAASDFLQKSNNLSGLTNLATARTNLEVYSKAQIDGFVLKNNANVLPSADNQWSLGNNSNRWSAIYANRFYGLATTAGSITSINNIGDVDTAGAGNNSVLKYNSSSSKWEVGSDISGGGGGGSATFVGLSDTPSNFTGDAGKYLKVNSGSNAIEFDTLNTTDVAEGTNLYYTNARADARAQLKVDALVAAAPGSLDTLNELAAALGDDANFSTTITNSIATKLATADFNSTFDTRLSGKSTTNVSEGTNLYYTNARADARISNAVLSALSNVHTAAPADGQVLAWDNGNSRWAPSSTGAGDITAVVAGTGLTGGATSGSATLNVDVGTSANKIVQLDGSAKLPAVDGSNLTNLPAAYTNASVDTHLNQSNPTAGYVLSWNGSDYVWVTNAGYTNADFDNRLASKSTTNLTEGANLYYTDARVNARVSALGSTNWNTAYGWGNHASAGYLTSLGALNDLSDVNTSGVATNKILKYNGSAWVVADDTGGPADTDALSEGSSNLYFTNARADARIGAAGLADLGNVDTPGASDNNKILYYNHGTTSFKWKVDASGSSYANSDVDAHLNQSGPSSGYVLSWNGSDYAWVANGTGGITDIVNDSTPQLGGTLDANGNTIDMGTNVLTDTNLGQFITAYGWGNHASAGYLSSETFTSLVQDTTPQLGGNLDVQTSTIKSSGYVQLGEGISATGFTGTLASRINGLAAYFTKTVDNSKRHYSTGWNNTQTLSANTDAANKKQGWHTDSTLKLGGFTHGTNDPNDITKLYGDYSYTNLTSSGNTTANGVVGHAFQAEVRDDSTGTINTSHIIGVRARAGNYKAGSTATNAYGLYVDTAKDGSATITNRYSIYAPQSSDTAYFAGPVKVGAWTLPIADGTNGQVLKTDGSGNVTWNSDTGHTNTDTLTEGSSNLYFTNARADARITNAGVTGAKVTNWDTAYGWGNHASAGYLTSYTPGADSIKDTMIDFGTGANQVSTADVPEATNLYYTEARADARVDAGFTAKSTTNLSEGTNLYFTNSRADARITAALIDEDNMATNSATRLPSQQSVKAYVDSQILTKDNTDEIAEGSTNLYFTNTRADARITNALIDEDNMASNSATKLPSQQSVKAYVDSQVGSENELSEMNDVTIASIQDNQFLKYNSTSSKWENVTVTASSAAGSNTHVQFNDGGVMGADGDFTYNKTTNKITVGSVTTTGASPAISSSGALAISTTASNNNITITPHGTGDVILDGQKWPQADGSANQYLKTNGSGQLSWDSLTTADVTEGANLYFTNARADARIAAADTGDLSEGSNLYYTDARADARITNATLDEDNMASNSNTKIATQQSIKAYVDAQVAGKDNTDEITEGSTNLYFTNARAISAVQGTNINMGSNNITTTGKILYANVYSAEGDLPSASTYHGMFAHVHGTGAGYFAHAGNWIKLANNSQLSNSSNWDTAFGWGNHASAGYLTSVPAQSFASLTGKPTTIAGYGITNLNALIDGHINQSNPTSGYVLSWNGSDYAWVAQSGGGASAINDLSDVTISSVSSGQVLKYNGSAWVNAADAGGIALTDLSVGAEGSASGNGGIAYNNSNGTFTYSPPTAAGIGALADLTGSDLDTLADVNNATPTDGQVLTWDNSNSYWKPATPSGGGSTVVERFKINYATNGQLSSITDKTSGISSVTIDSAAGGDITINTTGYSYPPANIIYYGYQHASNKYNVLNMNKDVTLREVPGGGSSGSPTAFGSFASVKVKAAEGDTGAGRGFGTVTHAWVQLVMGG